MKTLVNDQVVVLNNKAFYQYTDGEKVFTGVVSEDKSLFFPVFGIEGEYGDNLSFESDLSMAVDSSICGLWIETRSMEAIHNNFLNRILPNPQSVSNKTLYFLVKKAIERA